MAPLTDPIRLQAYRDALRNWEFTDYVQFALNEQAYRWVRRELNGISLNGIKQRMYEYVMIDGGEIDEQPETRPEWSGRYSYHHDLRLAIRDKLVYIETRLNCWMPFIPDQSWILVVNIHAP